MIRHTLTKRTFLLTSVALLLSMGKAQDSSLAHRERPVYIFSDMSHEFTFMYDWWIRDYFQPEECFFTSNLATIHKDSLLGYQIMMVEMHSSTVRFAEGELEAIKTFVHDGGGLLIIGNGAFWAKNHEGSAGQYPLNKLASEFDFQFLAIPAIVPPLKVNAEKAMFPVTDDLKVDMAGAGTLWAPENAYLLVSDTAGIPIVAARSFGRGQIVVVAQHTLLSPAHTGRPLKNERFVRSIFEWLSEATKPYRAPYPPKALRKIISSSHDEIMLPMQWLMKRGDSIQWKDPWYDDRHWKLVSTTSGWEEADTAKYRGYGWYRLHVQIPSVWVGNEVKLLLGEIDDVDETYFNGILIGRTGAFPPRYEAASDRSRNYAMSREVLRFGADNVIAVRVYNDGERGGMYREAYRFLPEHLETAGKVRYYYAEGVRDRAELIKEKFPVIFAKLDSITGVNPIFDFTIILLASGGGGYSSGDEIGLGCQAHESYLIRVIAHELTHSWVHPGPLPNYFNESWASLIGIRVATTLGYVRDADDERRYFREAFESADPTGKKLDLNHPPRSEAGIPAYTGKAMWLAEQLEARYGNDFLRRFFIVKRKLWKKSEQPSMNEFVELLGKVAGEDLRPYFESVGTKF